MFLWIKIISIKEFAIGKYNVTFDMFSKINVNGSSAHPMWAFLKEKQGGFLMNAIKWNFTKFVVDKVNNLFPNKRKNLLMS